MAGHAESSSSKSADDVARTIRHAILEGKYEGRFEFPSMRYLAREHGVSLRVAQTAVAILEADGLVYRRERRGTFVRPAGDRPMTSTVPSTLRCVNVVERITGTTPAFVRTGYLRGYTDALEQHDVKMRIATIPEDNDSYESLFSPLFPFQAQGCILINVINPALIAWLDERNIPFVVQSHVCYNKKNMPGHHSVAVNKVGGGFIATKHLLDIGHHRIGFIGRRYHAPDHMAEVYEGYRSALRCAGAEELPEDTLEFVTDELQHAIEPMRQYLQRDDIPTALVTENDMTAIGVLEAARTLGVHVPDQLSIVGYNDQAEAATTSPPLTTISNHIVRLGSTAVETLFAAASGTFDTWQTRVLNCHLIERGTTAAPRI